MEALFHLIVPVSVALAAGSSRKRTLTLAILTVLPDIDHAIAYRALFHNVFFLLLIMAAIYRATHDREMAFLAAFFIGSHLLFDIGGGIAIFYPIDNRYYALQASIVGKAGVTVPRFELSLASSGSKEWMSALHEKLSKAGRVWASNEMLMALLLAAVMAVTVFCFKNRQKPVVAGVSTHNPESRSYHRALGHHPPVLLEGGTIIK